MSEQADRALEIRYTLNASPEEAFDAWVTPEIVEAWWGPNGYRTKVLKLDAVEGGSFLFQMTGPSGASCPMSGSYTKIERPDLLAFTVEEHCVADMPDGVAEPEQPSRVEVRFKSKDGKTEIVLQQIGLSTDYMQLADVGWSQSLKRNFGCDAILTVKNATSYGLAFG